jgi:hypothetical protein
MKPRNALFLLASASVILSCAVHTFATSEPKLDAPSDTHEISPALIRHPNLDRTYWNFHRRARNPNRKHLVKTCGDEAPSTPACEHA